MLKMLCCFTYEKAFAFTIVKTMLIFQDRFACINCFLIPDILETTLLFSFL